MIPMTFEETIKLDLENTQSWLLKNNFLNKDGRVSHTVFFKTEDDAKNALKHLRTHDYTDSYADILEDDSYPFMLEFSRTIIMNKEHIDIDIKNILNLLKQFDYDYNNFTILIYVDDENTVFFNPAESDN